MAGSADRRLHVYVIRRRESFMALPKMPNEGIMNRFIFSVLRSLLLLALVWLGLMLIVGSASRIFG